MNKANATLVKRTEAKYHVDIMPLIIMRLMACWKATLYICCTIYIITNNNANNISAAKIQVITKLACFS